jgi:ABC-2 type transport system permease protein
VYNFFLQAYLNYKGLFYWLNWPGFISSIIVQPAVSVVLYVILGRFMLNPAAAQYYALGITVSSMAFVIIGGIAQTYSYDRRYLTISFVFVSAVNRPLHFLSRAIFHFPNALLAFIACILMIRLMTDVDFGAVNWFGLVLTVLILAASICAFAQFLSIFIIVTRDWMNTLSLSMGFMLVLTGMIVPLSIFPAALQEFARVLPATNGLEALRSAFSGVPLSKLYWLIGREAITGLVYFMIGAAGFNFFEKVAKHSGALETET